MFGCWFESSPLRQFFYVMIMSKLDLSKILPTDDWFSTFRAPVPRKDLDEFFENRLDEKSTYEFLGCKYLIEEMNSYNGDWGKCKYRGALRGYGVLATILEIDGEPLDLSIGYYDDEYWDFAIGAAQAFILCAKNMGG